MRHQGRITQWKDEQGYGFITPNGGGEGVFLHIKAFRGRRERPVGDEIVTYELARDPKGRLQAAAVEFVRGTGRRNARPADGPSSWPTLASGLFIAFLIAAALAGKLPLPVLGLYAGASGVAFIAYWMDKSAARAGRWRTPESTLHLLSLIGGWPGALLAQRRLRHKSAKLSFQIAFWATALLNCGALGLLLNPTGVRALRSALAIA
ncbi:DUF1294 domain-containing protein [Dechloromonas sp. XY25]|uniref:DUF1294 domain-containing protein n=1 Tax=Dechloromonas hankyongensis TaxID=2908002 RepID=A0ABS9K0A9_9RHOO|nr:DUF1294 domain-containing protein [Dechloromonas hankyongensis]MCG2576578.1 DUF1294 domain-containing protein [Dechloromonas hankyongensis]